MPHIRTIAEALRYSDADVDYVERRGSRWRRVSLAMRWLLPMVLYALLVWRAVLSWGDGQWDAHVWPVDTSLFIWFVYLPMMPTLLLPYLGFDFLLAQSRLRPGLAQLRDAAIELDGQLALYAAAQPVPFPSPLLPSHAVPITLPTHLGDRSPIRLMGLSFAACPISIIGMSILAFTLPATDEFRMIGLTFGGVALVLLIPCWLVLRRRPRRGEQAQITVDADGLSWTAIGLLLDARQVRVSWHELRAFFTCVGEDSGVEHRLYALAAADELFTWEVRGDSPDDMRERSDLLCRLIATYTDLPLRDISAAVTTLDDVTPRAATRWSERIREARTTHAPLAPMDRRVRRDNVRWRFRLAMLSLVALTLLPSLTYLSIYAAQRYQSHIYADLLAQVHSHAPRYHDALNVPNSDWPLLTPTTDDPGGYGFAHGAYQLGGDTQAGYMVALTSNQSSVVDGDMAVEVTVRQYGGPDYLGVGLALSAHPPDDNPVIFTISPADMWYLHTPAQTSELFSFQGKQYVHGQAGASNRLTLIVRQGEYICYINDHFVGVERAPARHPLSVGVAMLPGTSSMTGVFSDFTVYAL